MCIAFKEEKKGKVDSPGGPCADTNTDFPKDDGEPGI